jgi:hypothetical protein
MYRACRLMGGLVLAVTLAGCGESPPESGTVPFKATSSPAIDGLSKQYSDQVKKGMPANKSEEASKPTSESKAAGAEAKPSTDAGKPEEKKKD